MTKLESHPGKTLHSHLKNTADLSRKIINSKEIENKSFYSKIAYLTGLAHDFAKATTFFQNWLNKGTRSEKARHSHLSSIFGYYLIKEYLNYNNLEEKFKNLPAITFIVINKHHGNLANIMGGSSNLADKLKDKKNTKIVRKQSQDIKEKNYAELKSIYEDLLNGFGFELDLQRFFDKLNGDKFFYEIYREIKNLVYGDSAKNYVDIMFFYSVLLDSDKLDASGIEKIPSRWDEPLVKETVDRYKKIKFGRAETEINKVREDAYADVNRSIENLDLDDRILSINLPTGAGKTLTALSASFKLRNRIEQAYRFTPKIIYSLPFLSIIDQNSSVFREILADIVGLNWEDIFTMKDDKKERLLKKKIPSNLLLIHHHLADVKYKEKIKENEIYNYEDLLNSLLLTEGWYSEVVVSTFVQLFHSLITNKNRSARKFHNIVNSIIILDEVQSIPAKYWNLIKTILTILSKKFNCWIICMTATKPLIFGEKEVLELASQKEEYFGFFDRINYDFNLKLEELGELKDLILSEEGEKDIMVVVNTINSCKAIYDDLKKDLSNRYNQEYEIEDDGICHFENLEIINLSTHLLPSTRMKRINRIKKSDKRKIIVTTQLIEAGVDIDVDIVYRDFAPLDSIIQAAGRCNREFNNKKGRTEVIKIKDKSTQRCYSSYIYDSTILGATEETIKKFSEEVTERKFNLESARNYYKLVRERKAQDRQILEDIEKLRFMDIAQFDLIEEEVKSVSLFVEIDEEAKKLRKKLEEELSQTKGFERKKRFLKWRKELNEYVLSIRGNNEVMNKLETLDSFLGNEDFKIIHNENLGNWYDPETGFKVPESTFNSRFV